MFKVVVRMMCALPMLTCAASDNSRTVIRHSVFRLFSIDVTADGPIVDFAHDLHRLQGIVGQL